jgi:hypothetical protein
MMKKPETSKDSADKLVKNILAQPLQKAKRCHFLMIRKSRHRERSRATQRSGSNAPPVRFSMGWNVTISHHSGNGARRLNSSRVCGHSGLPMGLISDSNFQNGGLNE